MGIYKVLYSLGPQGEYVYPAVTRSAVWKNLHYHYTDKAMIAETDADIKADGHNVVLLTKADADSLIAEFKKSYPPPPKDDPLSLPK